MEVGKSELLLRINMHMKNGEQDKARRLISILHDIIRKEMEDDEFHQTLTLDRNGKKAYQIE
ncbi:MULTISPECIES: hypothetical protein [Pseudomonas]|uniref:hypothetical protein n=1 Tax=Pseudomonas TaxID=286 RepID=UPI0015E3953E|nr:MULTISPECIES: hypothetical protein [Pseudomonas]MBA1230150.1 hypothetical protein [Pseudomonas viridiflava]MCT8945369.1 hypothetical protein [Pseudomonas iridis]MEE4149557.1 hypothetical protein [Pseudomonas viridiflava]